MGTVLSRRSANPAAEELPRPLQTIDTVFSVVIPLYNKRRAIHKALQSVLAQTYQDYEILVIDDGSTDGSVDELQGYLAANLRIIQKPNGGPSSARNEGMRLSRGELVAFLDADDEWLPHHLEQLNQLACQFPEALIYGTNHWTVNYADGSRRPTAAVPPSPWTGLLNYFRCAAMGPDPLHTSAVAVKQSTLADFGGFNESYRVGEDGDFWCRLCLSGALAYDSTPSSIYYFQYPDGLMATWGISRCVKDFLEAPLTIWSQRVLAEGSLSCTQERDVASLLHAHVISQAKAFLLAGRTAPARQVLSLSPRVERTWMLCRVLSHLPAPLLRGLVALWKAHRS